MPSTVGDSIWVRAPDGIEPSRRKTRSARGSAHRRLRSARKDRAKRRAPQSVEPEGTRPAGVPGVGGDAARGHAVQRGGRPTARVSAASPPRPDSRAQRLGPSNARPRQLRKKAAQISECRRRRPYRHTATSKCRAPDMAARVQASAPLRHGSTTTATPPRSIRSASEIAGRAGGQGRQVLRRSAARNVAHRPGSVRSATPGSPVQEVHPASALGTMAINQRGPATAFPKSQSHRRPARSRTAIRADNDQPSHPGRAQSRPAIGRDQFADRVPFLKKAIARFSRIARSNEGQRGAPPAGAPGACRIPCAQVGGQHLARTGRTQGAQKPDLGPGQGRRAFARVNGTRHSGRIRTGPPIGAGKPGRSRFSASPIEPELSPWHPSDTPPSIRSDQRGRRAASSAPPHPRATNPLWLPRVKIRPPPVTVAWPSTPPVAGKGDAQALQVGGAATSGSPSGRVVAS